MKLLPLLLITCLAVPALADKPKTKLPVLQNQQKHSSGHRYLANPSEEMKSHYKFLIIGSGYGASVAALRIAEAGGNPAVIERGQEWLPGDFPEKPDKIPGMLRSSLNPLGLINNNTNIDADMDVIGASALGGTSQLNAAITLRPPANVWGLDTWPKEVREDFASGDLEKYYQTAESMLLPNVGPNTRELPKSKAHLENFPPEVPTGELTLNVNHVEGRQNHGVTQHACTCCGNCCGGCNVGAKNTLTTNYLPAAKDLGAEIYTQIEIDHIENLHPIKNADGELSGPRYRVYYTRYEKKGMLKVAVGTQGSVTADNVFLGAGSAGSTQILMRSKSENFKMSPLLGTRVSANGDVLGFVYNSREQTNIAAFDDTKSLEAQPNPVGQTITVYGDYREFNKDEPIEKQFVLLDGAIPRPFVAPAKEALGMVNGPLSLGSYTNTKRIVQDLLPIYPLQGGALNHSMMLLACGHDSSSGRYELDRNGSAYVVWPNMQKEASFQYINAKMEEYAKRMGGKFIPNPRSEVLGGNKMQATHPLGGVPMGDSIATGAANHLGQIYDGETGGVHEGLFVVDAALIPQSLAAPPLATITALAERTMRHVIAWYFHPCESLAGMKWRLH